MSDAFKETNSETFRNMVTFVTGFGIIADQPFVIGSPTTVNSNLITYNYLNPLGGISGYINSTGIQSIAGSKTFIADTIFSGDIYINSLIKNFTNEGSISLILSRIYEPNTSKSIDWGIRCLSNNAEISVLDWQNNILTNSNEDITLDWENRILFGNWNISSLYISGSPVITSAQTGGLGGGSVTTKYRAGQQTIGNLSTSQPVLFSSPLSSTGYAVSITLDGTLASAVAPSATSKTISGFTINLSAGIAGGVTADYTAWLFN